MRKVIYLSGITASGKTTIAEKLSNFLGIPFYKADDVYSMISQELRYTKQEELVMPEMWKKFRDFGELKYKYYKKLLGQETGDFIIEGFPLFFEQDRQLIHNVIGGHDSTFFRFNLPFPRWKEIAWTKYGRAHSQRDFEYLNSFFEPPAEYYELLEPEKLFVTAEKYQRNGFTDKKWELLDLKSEVLGDKSIMDLGCNAGWIGDYCLKNGANSASGVDYNWRYLEEARAKGLKTYFSDLDDFEFPNKYDIVFCLAVFHYVKDKEKLLRKISENTKELFILEVPVCDSELPALALHDTGKCEYFIPSLPLLDLWLKRYFSSYTISDSVAPDKSKRFIFKCYK